MLQGCPTCGSKTFFYVRSAAAQKLAERIKVITGIGEGQEAGTEADEALEAQAQNLQLDIESIRILKPGVYVLNLEALFRKEGIIMGIKEDGKYVIHLPSLFKTKRKRREEK